jgi:hypothetical protein
MSRFQLAFSVLVLVAAVTSFMGLDYVSFPVAGVVAVVAVLQLGKGRLRFSAEQSAREQARVKAITAGIVALQIVDLERQATPSNSKHILVLNQMRWEFDR